MVSTNMQCQICIENIIAAFRIYETLNINSYCFTWLNQGSQLTIRTALETINKRQLPFAYTIENVVYA